MRNGIANSATGKPVTTISNYYDKLIREDNIKDLTKLSRLCNNLNISRIKAKGTYKEDIYSLFQEISDLINIPFQDVFGLWEKDHLLLVYETERTLPFWL